MKQKPSDGSDQLKDSVGSKDKKTHCKYILSYVQTSIHIVK